jgi:hypothetical protein
MASVVGKRGFAREYARERNKHRNYRGTHTLQPTPAARSKS